MIYILAGITGMCGLICLCGLLEKLWDMLSPTTEAAHRLREISRNRQHKKPLWCWNTEAAGWNRFRTPVSTSTIPESGGKCNADI